VFSLFGSGTKSHKNKTLTGCGMKDIMDLQFVDKQTLSVLTADVTDDKGKVICPNATMNIWSQNSIIFLSDMIKGLAETE
jgi:hypothetical protein